MSTLRTVCCSALLLSLPLLPAVDGASADVDTKATANCSTAAGAPLEMLCGGNGHCAAGGTCECVKPWTGPTCELLDFLPAPANTSCGPACAYHGDGNQNTSWGGQVVQNPVDKLFYMAVSEFSGGCGLSTWRCNSQVALARSHTPIGPYKKLGVAVNSWAHNAAIVALPDGGMAIFSLGDGYSCAPGSLGMPTTNCTDGGHCDVKCPKPSDTNPAAAGNDAPAFRLHYAASPAAAAASFPWSYLNVTLQGYKWGFPGNWNPAPTLLRNGSLRVMAHDSWGSMRGTAIFQTDGLANYRGPFKLVTDDQAPSWVGSTRGTEDNFYWQDAKGNYHCLYHWLAGHANNGGHSWSKDGFRWSNVSAAYTGAVPLVGGGHLGCNRQRPKLLFDASGKPTHLFSGCGTRKGTYTVVAPLNV
jgi:hypothetical protein